MKKSYAFIRRQIQEVSDGGLPVLYRKLIRRFSIFGVLSAIPAVLVIRAIKSICHIRFGTMISDRIGHFAGDAVILLSEKVLTEPHFVDWYWFNTPTCNDQFERMVRRVFYVRWWVKYLYLANRFIPGGSSHEMINPPGSLDIHGLLERAKNINASYLPFSSDDEKEAESFLSGLGWKQGERFVCLLVRDSAYLDNAFPGNDCNYHNYRDSYIDTYHAAAMELAERGYWVFRMGKHMHHPFCCSHPRVIDYAFNEKKSDLLDIWLMANCYFCVTTGTGTDEISASYRRPIVYVNYLPVSHFSTWRKCICIPKHLIWRNSCEYVSLQEHLEHNYLHSSKYEESGIDVVDLSPKEIKDAVLEMEERLAGTWIENADDAELHQKFWEIFKSGPDFSKLHDFIHPDARIGASFLRNHPGFLSEGKLDTK